MDQEAVVVVQGQEMRAVVPASSSSSALHVRVVQGGY